MKELKFRAKANINNEWIYASNIHKVISVDTNEELWVMHPKNEKIEHLGDGYIKYRPLVVNEETIGQYTGLKDKYGVEIYEGDILKCVDEYTTIGVLEYATNIGTYIVRYTRDGDYYYSPLNRGDISRGLQLQETEIIGNIHENGDLLKWKKRLKKLEIIY